jgi:hypothetical protein
MENTLKHSRPSRIVVLADSCSRFFEDDRHGLIHIELAGDLGHFMNIVNKEKPHHFNGWMGSVLALAMISYCNETDFIYKEADCLAFGDWIPAIYEGLGDGGIAFGNCSFMPCEQSLFIVRHSYIPEFCRLILGQPRQDTHENLGEHIFRRLEEQNPTMWRRFGFGVGRDRPMPDGGTFYAQKITDDELKQLKSKGLI